MPARRAQPTLRTAGRGFRFPARKCRRDPPRLMPRHGTGTGCPLPRSADLRRSRFRIRDVQAAGRGSGQGWSGSGRGAGGRSCAGRRLISGRPRAGCCRIEPTDFPGKPIDPGARPAAGGADGGASRIRPAFGGVRGGCGRGVCARFWWSVRARLRFRGRSGSRPGPLTERAAGCRCRPGPAAARAPWSAHSGGAALAAGTGPVRCPGCAGRPVGRGPGVGALTARSRPSRRDASAWHPRRRARQPGALVHRRPAEARDASTGRRLVDNP